MMEVDALVELFSEADGEDREDIVKMLHSIMAEKEPDTLGLAA